MQKGCLFSLLSPRRPFSPPQCPTFGDLLPLTNLVWPFLRPPATGLKVSMFLSLNSPSFRLRIPSSIPSGKLLLILLPFLFFFISFFWVFYYVMLLLISKFFNDGEGRLEGVSGSFGTPQKTKSPFFPTEYMSPKRSLIVCLSLFSLVLIISHHSLIPPLSFFVGSISHCRKKSFLLRLILSLLHLLILNYLHYHLLLLIFNTSLDLKGYLPIPNFRISCIHWNIYYIYPKC